MSKEILHNDIGTAFLITRNDGEDGVEDKRAFFSSKNVDIFPCSRRGQQYEGKPGEYESNPVKVYDPEARLNTERTNRLRTAINGFKESFIYSFDSATNKLIFVLAGYRVEVRNIDLNLLADKLLVSNENILYAHLSLHDNVSLMVEDYFTEILYRQSTETNDANSLDVNVAADDSKNNAKFFVGISFTNNPNCEDSLADSNRVLAYHNLPIFKKDKLGDSTWQSELVQTSLLPKIDHGETENSVKIPGDSFVDGDFIVKHLKDDGDSQTTFSVTKDKTTLGATEVSELTVTRNYETDPVATIKDGIITADKAVIGDLDVGSNIDTSTLKATTDIATPLLKTSKITSDSTEIVVDKVLKVDTINSDSTNGLTIKRATKLEKTLAVEGATTINDTITAEKLVIPSRKDENGKEKGEVDTPQLRVNRITSSNDNNSITIDNKKLIVNKSLEMLAEVSATDPAKATIEQAIIGDLTVKEDSKLKNSTGKITAKEVAAETITQNGNQVPAIAIEQSTATPEVWQLQVTNVIKKTIN